MQGSHSLSRAREQGQLPCGISGPGLGGRCQDPPSGSGNTAPTKYAPRGTGGRPYPLGASLEGPLCPPFSSAGSWEGAPPPHPPVPIPFPWGLVSPGHGTAPPPAPGSWFRPSARVVTAAPQVTEPCTQGLPALERGALIRLFPSLAALFPGARSPPAEAQPHALSQFLRDERRAATAHSPLRSPLRPGWVGPRPPGTVLPHTLLWPTLTLCLFSLPHPAPSGSS